jgi:hypothetical protein
VSTHLQGEVWTGVGVQRQHLVDVGQVHFQAMLLLVYAPGHGLETPFLLDLFHERSVYGEVSQRCAVGVAAGGCGACEVVVMRWTEEEHAFATDGEISAAPEREERVCHIRIRPVGALIGPCSRRPRVRVSSVSASP